MANYESVSRFILPTVLRLHSCDAAGNPFCPHKVTSIFTDRVACRSISNIAIEGNPMSNCCAQIPTTVHNYDSKPDAHFVHFLT